VKTAEVKVPNEPALQVMGSSLVSAYIYREDAYLIVYYAQIHLDNAEMRKHSPTQELLSQLAMSNGIFSQIDTPSKRMDVRENTSPL
jgi:hypothetical protein